MDNAIDGVKSMLGGKSARFAAALACLYAWLYIAFFYGVPVLAAGGELPLLPDRCWAIALVGQLLCSGALLLASRKKPVAISNSACVVCAATTSLGTVVMGLDLYLQDSNLVIYVVGALLAGMCATPLWFMLHAAALRLSKGAVHGVVPAALMGAFVMYFVVRALPGLFSVLAAAVLPLVSAALAVSDARRDDVIGQEIEQAQPIGKDALRDRVLSFLLIGLLWANVAFFTTVGKPWKQGVLADKLYPLIVAALLATAAVMFAVAVFRKRSISPGAVPKMVALVLCVGYFLLYINFTDYSVEMVACLACSVCIVLMQAFAWNASDEVLRRVAVGKTRLALWYFAAAGAGISGGVLLGIKLCFFCNRSIPPMVPFLFLAILFFFVMSVDIHTLARGGDAGSADVDADGECGEDALDALFDRFELSERERDVARLLAAGYSRPAIQKELFLSAGTVNFHVSNIYRKTDVHSRQEFVSLCGERR